jgi:hypothetical protein
MLIPRYNKHSLPFGKECTRAHMETTLGDTNETSFTH